MKKLICCLACLCYIITVFVPTAHAQDTLLNTQAHGKLDSLHSAILQQERMIQVFVPTDYKPGSGKKYDVIYVLDGGNWNVGLVSRTQRFVENEGFMPSTIIVSVMGIDRNVELTPTHLTTWKGSGGGAAFLSYIKNELIPYINKNYPSNGDNMLWGHSLSGMFVIYAMVNEPELFKSYIAVDPSIWWDNAYVAKQASAKLPMLTSQNMTLFIAGRETAMSEMKTDTMETVLKNAAPKNLNWKVQVYTDETHSSVRLKSTYDGLRFAYRGMTGHIEFHPMNGIVLKESPYPVWYFGDTTYMHYTIDGTTPINSSPKVRAELMIKGPATVTYKSFGNRSRYNQTATGNFKTEKMPNPGTKPKNFKPGGFNYSYYETKGDTSGDLKKLKPVKTGIADKDFDIDKLPSKNNFALVFDGYFKVKENGYYIFGMTADKGSKLYIAGKLMITWNGSYGGQNYSCIIPLSKGFYPIRLEYYHRNQDFKLDWGYLPPANLATKQAISIPLELQYGLK
jgi:predicted alpha/beta superfamily hydrolase